RRGPGRGATPGSSSGPAPARRISRRTSTTSRGSWAARARRSSKGGSCPLGLSTRRSPRSGPGSAARTPRSGSPSPGPRGFVQGRVVAYPEAPMRTLRSAGAPGVVLALIVLAAALLAPAPPLGAIEREVFKDIRDRYEGLALRLRIDLKAATGAAEPNVARLEGISQPAERSPVLFG